MTGTRASTAMTMRAVVQRNQTATVNAHGHPDAPSWATLDTFPCRVWSQARRHSVTADRAALVEDLRIMFRLSTGITEADQISSVTDRAGTTLYAGPLELEAGQFKHDHVEFSLRRIK